MGNDIAQPAWHRSVKLNNELRDFHDRVAMAAEKAAVEHSGNVQQYLDTIRDRLRHRNVFVFLSMDIIHERWREEERRLTECKDDEPIKFEVACLLDGGNDLIAEKIKSNGNVSAGNAYSLRLSKHNKQTEPTRELFRQTTLRYLEIISADETRKRFMEHIEGSLKEVKIMTDGYRLQYDRSSIRLDVFQRGKVYMMVFLILHYDVNGCRYIPEPYHSMEPRTSWIISTQLENMTQLDPTNKCQLEVLHLLRIILRVRPELSALGSRPLTESMLTEVYMTSPDLWTIDNTGARLLAVLTRLEAGLVDGNISPKVVKNKQDKNTNLLDAIPYETLSNAATFVKRIISSETDFYQEILEPSKSSRRYKYFEKMTLITHPNDLYSV